MGKNILILSDATARAGGLLPDETRTNVYKLYRATRCGPDSTIDPSKQLAFYDPGLGSQTDGGRIKFGWARWFFNLLAQGTGLGITRNINDCYAAILTLWRPGDRVYLFGFSRGAYTVRCVGGVLALCGIPTRMKDGSGIRYDPETIRAIAKEAVKEVYQYGSSMRGDPFKELRLERAKQFRKVHGSDENGHANVYPYFIGVFDTVAALGVTPKVRRALAITIVVLVACIAAGLAWWLANTAISSSIWFSAISGLAALAFVIPYLWTHLKWHPVRKRFYLAEWSMKFYDRKLNRRVGYARHALSIDEARKDFERVEWEYDGDARRRTEDEPGLLRQVWFAGDHSDIGGSYEENESRLSDITLGWMLEQLKELPHPIYVNDAVLRLFPSPVGPQHDESRSGFPGIWGALGFKWDVKHRSIPPEAPLHQSVLDRFAAPAVLQYDVIAPYRPVSLRQHERVKHFYETRAAPCA